MLRQQFVRHGRTRTVREYLPSVSPHCGTADEQFGRAEHVEQKSAKVRHPPIVGNCGSAQSKA
jgi:hypothetical protein